jgi:hypothetical protein
VMWFALHHAACSSILNSLLFSTTLSGTTEANGVYTV